MPYIKQPPATSEDKLTGLAKELQLWEEMNTAIEELLELKASMDCHCRELDSEADLAACHNDAQQAKANTCHAVAAIALQQAHLDSVSAMNCKVMTGEGQKHQAFTEKFSAALHACPSEDHWTLMYPLQLLTGGIPSAP